MSDITCTIPKSDKGGNLNRFNSSITYTISKSDDGGTLVNHTQLPVPRSGGTIEGQYRCEADDYTNIVFASANVQIYTKPIITTGLPTTQIKKSSGEP